MENRFNSEKDKFVNVADSDFDAIYGKTAIDGGKSYAVELRLDDKKNRTIKINCGEPSYYLSLKDILFNKDYTINGTLEGDTHFAILLEDETLTISLIPKKFPEGQGNEHVFCVNELTECLANLLFEQFDKAISSFKDSTPAEKDANSQPSSY